MILRRQGVGTDDNGLGRPIWDNAGTGMLPLQAEITGDAATFRVLAKATSEAPWREIIAGGDVGFLQSIAWVPFIQLEVLSGAGVVTLYIGEK
jgi:hypothetical protein